LSIQNYSYKTQTLNMINNLIKSAITNRFLTLILFIIITVLWIFAINNTAIDAIPDLSENQVVIMTKWAGQSPTNIEDQITYPLTISMQWLAWVKDVRAMSQLWISMVTVIFEDNVDIYFARDRITERLSLAKTLLPTWVNPILWPDATGLGQIFMYTIESENHTLTELRSIQDFNVSYALQWVSWVAEIASVWGYVKNYQIILDPIKLKNYWVKIQNVINSVKSSNNNVSWKVIDTWKTEIAVQWLWFFKNIQDIKDLVIWHKKNWMPLTIQDIWDVRISWNFRRSVLADENEEKVWWVVVMRYWENPLEVISAIKEKIKIIEKTLPEWVKIESFYDRTNLIISAIDTLKSVLTQELIITAIILWLFLWHFGSTLITTIALLVWVIMTFLFMYLFWMPSNIMSLWWIAIAIWTMVDAIIVITENAYKKLLENKPKDFNDRVRLITESTQEVWKPIVFAIFIIILSFIPIFSLEWMEWKLFSPLAFTNTFAMFWALISSLFLVPILCIYFLKWELKKDEDIKIVHFLQKIYKPILEKALKFRKATIAITIWLTSIWWILMFQIWSEFMPPLDEWAIMYMPMTVPDVSEKKAQELLLMTNEIIARFPEVEKVVWKAWRADTATDPAPLAMIETFITLKPKSERRDWMTKWRLISQMNRSIKINNLWNGFTQPIIWRIDMLSTWIRAQVWIKIFWDDPIKIEEIAIKIEKLMSKIPWASWVAAIRTTGLKYLNIDLQDDLLAMHWIQKSEALQIIQAWIWWSIISYTIEWREKYWIELKLKQSFRENIDEVRSLVLIWKWWQEILLDSIADIKLENWPAVINSENWVIRWAVQMNVQWRDLAWFVEESKLYIQENIVLPNWYFIEWAGQYENQLRAKDKLSIIVPIVLLTIFILLFLDYKDIWLVSIVMITIPLSLVWWIIALYIADFNFSVAVWVWFIALFWNAVETWVVVIVYLENAFRKQFWMPLVEWEEFNNEKLEAKKIETKKITREWIYKSVIEWATLRLRPILMTAFTSIIWLLPMIFSTWVWSEVQKPLAIVVVWGLFTSIALTLILLPVLFSYLREREIKL